MDKENGSSDSDRVAVRGEPTAAHSAADRITSHRIASRLAPLPPSPRTDQMLILIACG